MERIEEVKCRNCGHLSTDKGTLEKVEAALEFYSEMKHMTFKVIGERFSEKFIKSYRYISLRFISNSVENGFKAREALALLKAAKGGA